MSRLELTVRADNEPARRLYEQAGFTAEGIRRGSLRVDDKLVDELAMALLLDPGAAVTTARLSVRRLRSDERRRLEQQVTRLWGSTNVISRGGVHDAAALPALVCEAGKELVGLATLDIRDRQCELVTLDAFAEGQGVGSALLSAVTDEARRHRCRRLWLITSNDNLRALRFYQRRGLRLAALHRGAIDEARQLKPEIPPVGEHGIPIHDELELELPLGG